MAIYNASLLISASNATYFTNVTGGIAAVAVRDLNDSWISSSALLSGSNTFVGNQIISGNVDINGTITASLQTGYLYVGDSSGKTQAVATSSIIANTDTGSLLVTGSVSGNTLTFTKGDASTFNLSVATGSTANIDTGSFATTGSNTFTGQQRIYANQGMIISGSDGFGYGITLQGRQGINISGDGGPRLQFPNEMWLNGNEADNFQFTGDTDNPKSRGLDFFLYGTGSRVMQFRNNSGNGATMTFQTTTGTGGNSIQFSSTSGGIQLNAGSGIGITGSTLQMQGLTYPTTDGTNGQALITNGSGVLSFGNVTINTGSFATTGSNTFNGDQIVNGKLTISSSANTYLQFTSPNSATGSGQIFFGQNGPYIQTYSDSNPDNQGLQLVGGLSGSFALATRYGGQNAKIDLDAMADQSNPATTRGRIQVKTNGQIDLSGLGGAINLSGSGTIIQGLTYPGTDGTNGQVITTNGSGVLTFTTITGSGGGTIDTGSFLTTGSFGTYQDVKGTLNIYPSGSNPSVGLGIYNTGSTVSGSMFFGVTGPGSPFIQLKNRTWFQIEGSDDLNYTNFTASFDNGISVGPNFGSRTQMLTTSGSLCLFNPTTQRASVMFHLSASQAARNGVNLVFADNTRTGTTIISGSNNIFTNPNPPTTNYIRYIGGANNIYLNSSNGINSEITASAISVSGVRPTMNNNIFQGTAGFIINQAVNSSTTAFNINNNYFGASNPTTINALAFTGSGFTMTDNLFKGGAVVINPASASIAEIAAGVSGSGAQGFELFRNMTLGQGTMTINIGPKSATGFNSFGGNIINSGFTITNISSSAQVVASNNNVTLAQTYTNAGARDLGIHRQVGQMTNNYGGMILIASASAISATANISTAAMTVTNRMYSGSVIGSGSLLFNNNINAGGNNTYTITGSFGGTGFLGMSNNATIGAFNTIFTNVEGRGNHVGYISNVVGGQHLILTGSNSNAITASGGGYFGRFNADDGIRNQTAENIFFVGTGTSISNRKTGFLIDSGSNSYFEGSLRVSGSTAMNGNQDITGSLLVSSFTTLASVSSSLNFADDTAAGAGGVPLGGLYRNGNFVMIRLT
jgi:hypothetical protein